MATDDLTTSKIDLELSIPESDLLTLLLHRYGSEVGSLGVHPEMSVIRDFTYRGNGTCVFSITAVTFSDAEGYISNVETRLSEATVENTEKKNSFSPVDPSSSDVEDSETRGGCPRATQTLQRIRKNLSDKKNPLTAPTEPDNKEMSSNPLEDTHPHKGV